MSWWDAALVIGVFWSLAAGLVWLTLLQFQRGIGVWPSIFRLWWKRDSHPVSFWSILTIYALGASACFIIGAGGIPDLLSGIR